MTKKEVIELKPIDIKEITLSIAEETMSNIIKASDVKDNHDAIENNQVQDSTKVKENQIPDEILRELAAMQKRFRELYSEYKLCGIGDSEGVHITSDAFIETFKDYETSAFNYRDYSEELTATMHGVTFFCIR
jgi:hypothetical protein